MNQMPAFYLTAIGEFPPLAEPRACEIKRLLRDSQGAELLVVSICPVLRLDSGGSADSLVLSPRHRGDSLTAIVRSPMHVYVSQMLEEIAPTTLRIASDRLKPITWGQIYTRLNECQKAFEQHAASLRSDRSPQTLHLGVPHFVGEQDGIPERELKSQLIRIFESDLLVWKAYLARADFGAGTGVRVVLCLRRTTGPDKRLVARIAKTFASLFRSSDALDILFIDSDQERELDKLCPPFYFPVVHRNV
jgi:hypothetical protein